jgi:hypothetical protein
MRRLSLAIQMTLRSLLGTALGSLLLIACLSSTAAANVTYSYTGSNYTSVLSPYTTEMNLTASITFAAPLAPNLIAANMIPSVLLFTMSDGLESYDIAVEINFPLLEITTDGGGNITGWSVGMIKTNGSRSVCAASGPSGTLCPGQEYRDIVSDLYLTEHALTTSPGTWTLVPEPGTGVLLAMGLTGLAAQRRRSN